jgi:hypothetical protein
MEITETYKDVRLGDSIYVKYHIGLPLDVLRVEAKNLDKPLIQWTKSHGFERPGDLISKSGHTFDARKKGSFLNITFNPDGRYSEMIIFLVSPDLSTSKIYNELIRVIKLALNKQTASKKFTERIIPAGSEDVVSKDDIQSGDTMIDFHDEYKHGRYYKETTFYNLNNTNPITRQPIITHSKYTAKVTSGGRRRTRKQKRKHKKTRKH